MMLGSVLEEALEIEEEKECLLLRQILQGKYYIYELSAKKCTVYDSNSRTCNVQHGLTGLPRNCPP